MSKLQLKNTGNLIKFYKPRKTIIRASTFKGEKAKLLRVTYPQKIFGSGEYFYEYQKF